MFFEGMYAVFVGQNRPVRAYLGADAALLEGARWPYERMRIMLVGVRIMKFRLGDHGVIAIDVATSVAIVEILVGVSTVV